MTKDVVPGSRTRRGATAARVATTEAIREAGTRAANVTRSPERGRLALERRHLDAADRIVAALGSMKGLAMKLGQMLSVLDLGVLPEDVRPAIQRKLGALRDAAPTVAFAEMRGVIERELGVRLSDQFADFDQIPIAAASIGQVYRGKLRDGRAVAVKVQYPGIQAAVRADLKNLALLMRLVARLAPGLDTEALAGEIRERTSEELDYRLEAANQQAFAELYRAHPFIAVPDVVPGLCRERLLVSELVDGVGFDSILAESETTRNRVGEIVYRFFCGSLYRLGRFSGDPHPGNFLLQPDGRVAFFDFGLHKTIEPTVLAAELAAQRAAAENDADALHRIMTIAGLIREPDRVPPASALAYVHDAIGWYLEDAERTLTSEQATLSFVQTADPRSPYYELFRDQNLPREHLLARRMELFVLATLGQLGARANWHQIAREWLYDDAPATELGALEAGFYDAKPGPEAHSLRPRTLRPRRPPP